MAATTAVAGKSPATRRRFDLSTRILVGIAAGVAVGLFIGERAAALQILADAYIKLLQMTVLPYVTMSLVGGLGALSATEARRLGLVHVYLGYWIAESRKMSYKSSFRPLEILAREGWAKLV